MERAAEDIEAEIANADKREEGLVGIAAPDGMAGYFLAPAFANFFHAWPKITWSPSTAACGRLDKIPSAIDISPAVR